MSKLIRTELLITGNGFDLSQGYNTRYDDFYSFLENYKKTESAEELCSIYKIYNETKLRKNFDRFKKVVTNNYFVKYLFSYKESFDSWFKFEEKLNDILIVFDNIFTGIDQMNFENDYFKFDIVHEVALELFDKPFNSYLDGYFMTHSNYTLGLIADLKFEGPYNYYSILKRTKEIKLDIKRKLKENLESFNKLLSYFIYLETSRKILSPIPRINPSKIITFNYSNLTEEIFSIDEENCCHLHGKCGDDIVVGIDTEKFENQEFNIFDKCFQRTNIPDQYKIASFIEKCNAITYIGFSFDICDSSFVKFVFSNSKVQHIILYKDKESKDSIVENIITIITKTKFTNLVNTGKLSFFPLEANVVSKEEYDQMLSDIDKNV